MAIMLMVFPGFSFAAQITDFGDGLKEATAYPLPVRGDTVNLTLPAECHVRKTAVNMTTAPYDPASPLCPEGLKVFFGQSLLYEFNGSGFGGFGSQELFIGGAREETADFGPDGGEYISAVRLPRKALVRNATFELECSGGYKLVPELNLSSGSPSSGFGSSLACGGDFNGDGYQDLAVGEPTYYGNSTYSGRVCIFFGGPDLGRMEGLNLTPLGSYSYFGNSVSCAGDVNGDGFDDLIAGAPYYSVGTTYYTGAAFIYYGGRPMDDGPDVAIYGDEYYDMLGFSVAGAGDLNGDGFDDVLVGEPYSNDGASYAGSARVFLGGSQMDNTSDVVITGNRSMGYLGMSVDGAGDVNGDGYSDIIVGIMASSINGYASGEARVYLGGKSMDDLSDLTLPGHSAGEYLGSSVAGAGDVNGDGFDDLVVGAMMNNSAGTYTGAAYVYLGGKDLDASADLTLPGNAANSEFGAEVAGGFDVNGDGLDDVAVGAPWEGPAYTYCGRAHIFYGGARMNTTADFWPLPGEPNELLGSALGGGDLNGDGRVEFAVGAPGWSGMGGGIVSLYGSRPGILAPAMGIANGTAFKADGYINRTLTTTDLSALINKALRSGVPSGWDRYGNSYCDIPLGFSGRGDGRISLRIVNLTYDLSVPVRDFSDELNAWLTAHRKEADASGNLLVPLRVESSSPGRVRFTDLSITIDEAPRLVQPVPDLALDEDTAANDILDLHRYFQDDFDSGAQLNYSILSSAGPGFIAVGINNNRFLSVDALEGEPNDNWTGTFTIVVRAQDHWGSGRASNEFNLTVRNINDPPVISSIPPLEVAGGVEWVYRILAEDGDRDRLRFVLDEGPDGMMVNSSTGVLTWIPQRWGRYPVALSVGDGCATDCQSFTLNVPNRPPRITSEPPGPTYAGSAFRYNLAAEDDDGDALSYRLLTELDGVAISPGDGLITGIPSEVGEFLFAIEVSDGRATAFQNFTLRVLQPNRAPYIASQPVLSAVEGNRYVYQSRAYDSDRDALEFSLEGAPDWLTVNPASGLISGTPPLAGNFTMALKVSDGRGGEGKQEYTLAVADSVKPLVRLSAPSPGEKLRGTLTVTGLVLNGTRQAVRVEVRLDLGSWTNATGDGAWSFSLVTTKLKDGRHTIEARAYDGWEYSDSARMEVEVDNSAVISLSGTGTILLAALAGAVCAGAGAGAFLWRKRAGKKPGKLP